MQFTFDDWSSSLEEQANCEGLTLGKQAGRLEELANATKLLYKEGILNEKYYDKVIDKLNKRINKETSFLS